MSFLKENTILGKTEKPVIATIYGPPGVGKTTLSSKAERPYLIDIENGAFFIDVPKSGIIDSPTTFLDYMMALIKEEHEYKTVVIDSISALDPLLTQRVFERFRLKNDVTAKSLEDFDYGKGYAHLFSVWLGFLTLLKKISNKGMNVILIGHQKIASFETPNGNVFKYFTINAPDSNNNSVLRAIVEFSDFIGFVNFEVPTEERKNRYNQKQQKGKFAKPLEHDRIIHVSNTLKYLAKTRFELSKNEYPVDEWDWSLLSSSPPASQVKDMVFDDSEFLKPGFGGDIEDSAMACEGFEK